MKICLDQKKFHGKTLEIIIQADEILQEYAAQGYPLTVRAVYYQFVSRNLISNSIKSYGVIQRALNDGRLAGLIDWSHIIDETRPMRQPSFWNSPSDILRTAADQFRLDHWADQGFRPEVWIEKTALVGVVDRTCHNLHVPLFASKGFCSTTELFRTAKRLRSYQDQGQQPIIFYLGDHDPSGMDITRDVQAKLSIFVGDRVRVDRLALNIGQVKEYRLPPNPAKMTDTRADGYVKQYGSNCWELDALSPQILNQLVRTAIEDKLDHNTLSIILQEESSHKKQLQYVARHWKEISE